MDATRENIERANEERFSRITPFYALIYTAGDAPKDAVEITGSETKRLSDADERWLTDCNLLILAEETEKRKPEILAKLGEQVEALEQALREKKEELAEE